MRDKRTPKDVCGEATNIADEHWRLAWTLAPWAQFSVASEWRMPALLCVSSFSGYVYCVVLFDTGECLLYNIELISVSDSLGEWIRLLGGKFTSQVFGDLSDATPRAYTIYTGPFHLISTPPLWMMFLFLQSLRNNVALTPSEIPMDEFKNIAAPLEIPMISSETLQKSTMDEFVF